jgi:hypothetical protein
MAWCQMYRGWNNCCQGTSSFAILFQQLNKLLFSFALDISIKFSLIRQTSLQSRYVLESPF